MSWSGQIIILKSLARMFHELLWRDREDGRATGQPQGVGSEAYLNGTSQGELVLSVAEGTPEDAREDGRIRGRSRRFMKCPGYNYSSENTRFQPQYRRFWSQNRQDKKLPVLEDETSPHF